MINGDILIEWAAQRIAEAEAHLQVDVIGDGRAEWWMNAMYLAKPYQEVIDLVKRLQAEEADGK